MTVTLLIPNHDYHDYVIILSLSHSPQTQDINAGSMPPCRVNVGQPSATLAQHLPNNGSLFAEIILWILGDVWLIPSNTKRSPNVGLMCRRWPNIKSALGRLLACLVLACILLIFSLNDDVPCFSPCYFSDLHCLFRCLGCYTISRCMITADTDRDSIPADTRRWINVSLTLVHRLRRKTNVKPTSCVCWDSSINPYSAMTT